MICQKCIIAFYKQNELTSLKDENQTLAFALQNSLDEIEAYKEQVCQLRERIAVPVEVAVPSHQAPETPKPSSDGAGTGREESETINEAGVKPLELLDKLTQSERQKEHWTVEYQLLKMKYERVIKVESFHQLSPDLCSLPTYVF